MHVFILFKRFTVDITELMVRLQLDFVHDFHS